MMMMMYFCSLSYSSFFLSTFVAPFFSFLFSMYFTSIYCAQWLPHSLLCLFDVGIPSFLSRTVFFVCFVLCDFVARRPHPFFASCFLSFCLSLSFRIEISFFDLALALSLFYPTNLAKQWSWCARQPRMYRREGNVGFASWLSVLVVCIEAVVECVALYSVYVLSVPLFFSILV